MIRRLVGPASQPGGLVRPGRAPIARGLKYLTSGAAQGVNLVNGYVPEREAGTSLQTGRHGPAIRGGSSPSSPAGFRLVPGDGTNGGLSNLVPVDSELYIHLRVNVRSLGSRQGFLSDYFTNGAGATFSVALEQGSANDWRFVSGLESYDLRTISGGTVTLGWHDIEYVYDKTAIRCYVDDSLIGSITVTKNRQNGYDLRALRLGAYTALGCTGEVAYIAIFDRALSDGERSSLRANPWQLFEPVKRYFSASVAPSGPASHSLSAAALAQAAATAALDVRAGGVAVDLAGAGQAQAGGSAALLKQTGLGASGAAQAAGSAALLKGVSLAGVGLAVATSGAAASKVVPLSASAVAAAASAGSISVGVSLSAAAVSQALGSATMGLVKSLAAGGAATAGSSAALSTAGASALSATAAASASSVATLSVMVKLGAAAVAQVNASASMAAGKPLAAAGGAAAAGSATLQVGAANLLAASALGRASSGATLMIDIPLSAHAVAQAMSAGTLSAGIVLSASAGAQAFSAATIVRGVRLSAGAQVVADSQAVLSAFGPIEQVAKAGLVRAAAVVARVRARRSPMVARSHRTNWRIQ